MAPGGPALGRSWLSPVLVRLGAASSNTVLSMSSLPTGVVTFLFTDVEGSTRLWEQDRAAMAASLALHDEILRAACAEHRGHVFSTAGDAFAVAFHSIAAATAAAVDIQRRLNQADWPGPVVAVRVGIHTGEAEERGGDYFGPVLNRAARIMSAGHGGQILLSSVAANDASADLHDLGTHHLKDLEDPEHVYEIRHPDLPVIERPIRTVDMRRHNLPDALTSFVGRDEELADLADLLADNRLIVLTGVGGTGKTRLAIEAAGAMLQDLPDGAWMVELAAVANPDLIMTVIGETWDLRPGEGATIDEVVTRYLWSRTSLLVIDNCEHVLPGASRAIRHILDSCPNVRILATSRESLGIAGEVTRPVPSLGLPEDDESGHASGAVQLFLDRAAAVRPGFTPSSDELAAISRICTRIDGIPLGIELAAARMRTMSPADLADRLDESFRILSRSAKTALPRQRTLQATIDWSHDLLDDAERAVFRRSSMFLGGFDLSAAEAVCVGEDVEGWEVVDHLDSLVDKSLVVAAHDERAGTRFRMLEPVRQYAQEQLSGAGESDAIAGAHAAHYAAFVAEAAPHTRSPNQWIWDRRLDLEYDNIRGAFDALLARGEIEPYLTMGFDLLMHHQHAGMHVEARQTLLDGLEEAPADVDKALLVKGWFAAALLSAQISDPAGIPYGRQGVSVAETLDVPNALGKAHLALAAVIHHSTNDPEHVEHLDKARELLEANPEPAWWEPAWEAAMLELTFAQYTQQDDPRKARHIEAALEGFEAVGDPAMLGAALNASAGLWGQVDDEVVIGNLRRSIELLREARANYWMAHSLETLGTILNSGQRFDEAIGCFSEAVELLRDCGDLNCWAGGSRGLAYAEVAVGRADRAAPRLAAVLEHMAVLPTPEWDLPFTLDNAAGVLQELGAAEQAAVVLGKAVTVPLPDESIFDRGEHHAAIREAAIAALGSDEVAELEATGAAMTTDDLIAGAQEWLLAAR